MDLSYVTWDPSPTIFTIGTWGPRWYGLLFASGFVFGYWYVSQMFKWEGKPEKDMDNLLVVMLISTVIGARLGHVLFYDPVHYLSHPIKILYIWEGGLASHGAAFAIIIGLYFFYSRKRLDQPFLWIIDRVVVVTALAGCFIRLGNLVNSEIVGEPTTVPWAFIFPAVDNLPRHPSQLYEALFYAATFFLLRWMYLRKRAGTPHGLLLGWFLVLIFGFRFMIEFLKKEQSAFEVGMPLNMGQILSIPLVILGVVLIYRAKPPVLTADGKLVVAAK